MSQFLEGIGALIGKVCNYIPGRIEGLKNKRDRLEKEKNALEILNLDPTDPKDRKIAQRLSIVRSQLADVERLLAQRAKDD